MFSTSKNLYTVECVEDLSYYWGMLHVHVCVGVQLYVVKSVQQ